MPTDERILTPEQVAEIRATHRCRKCMGTGRVEHGCSLCGDSTYDHDCNDWSETCGKCSGFGGDADIDALLASHAALAERVAALEDALAENTRELYASVPTTVAQRACELTCYVTRQWAAKAGYERPCTILAEEGKHVIPMRRFTDGPDTRIWVELIRDAFFMAQAEHDSAQSAVSTVEPDEARAAIDAARKEQAGGN